MFEHYLFIYMLDLYHAFFLKSWFKILHVLHYEREIYKISLGLKVDHLQNMFKALVDMKEFGCHLQWLINIYWAVNTFTPAFLSFFPLPVKKMKLLVVMPGWIWLKEKVICSLFHPEHMQWLPIISSPGGIQMIFCIISEVWNERCISGSV